MKKMICLIIAFSMFGNIALANCEWSSGVKKTDQGYLYSNECHGRVGLLTKDLDDRKIEVEALRKTIDFKELALQKADQRTELWREATFKVEDRLNNLANAQKMNNWVYFGLGIVTVFAAGYAAQQIYGAAR